MADRSRAALNPRLQPDRTMTEYQTVILRLQGRSRDDEEAITDLLNERARMGWRYHSLTQLEPEKVLVVFSRET